MDAVQVSVLLICCQLQVFGGCCTGISSVDWLSTTGVWWMLYRYQFFLQLKLDILTGRLPCEFDTCVELAAYVVQCMYLYSSFVFFYYAYSMLLLDMCATYV